MKSLAVLTLCLAVLAAPCVYDVASKEPSPLSAGLVASGIADLPIGTVMVFNAH